MQKCNGNVSYDGTNGSAHGDCVGELCSQSCDHTKHSYTWNVLLPCWCTSYGKYIHLYAECKKVGKWPKFEFYSLLFSLFLHTAWKVYARSRTCSQAKIRLSNHLGVAWPENEFYLARSQLSLVDLFNISYSIVIVVHQIIFIWCFFDNLHAQLVQPFTNGIQQPQERQRAPSLLPYQIICAKKCNATLCCFPSA